MQEVKFKIGDLVEFCEEKQQLLNNDLIYSGYGMIIEIYPGEDIDEMIYVVDIYKGTEKHSVVGDDTDIAGFKFMFYDTQIHHDMRLMNAGTKD